jgi:hypothetical protein
MMLMFNRFLERLGVATEKYYDFTVISPNWDRKSFWFSPDEWEGPKKYSNSHLLRTVPYRSVVCVDYVDNEVRVSLVNGDVITFFGGDPGKYDPQKLKGPIMNLPEKSALFEIADAICGERPVGILKQCRLIISLSREASWMPSERA